VGIPLIRRLDNLVSGSPMDDFLKVVLPAAMALFGTLFGLWLGQRRWSSELKMTKRRAFDAQRYLAYEALWKILEDAHITIRTGRPEMNEVLRLEQGINAFRLRNAILLDSADSELSNRYFDSILKLSKIIAESGSRELAEEFYRTAKFSTPDIAKINGLVHANREAEVLREELIVRIRAVMLETSYAMGAAK
jgi:hypothetical protein